MHQGRRGGYSATELQTLSKREIIALLNTKIVEFERTQNEWVAQKAALEQRVYELEERIIELEGQRIRIQRRVFAPSSERSKAEPTVTLKTGPTIKKKKIQKLSERYPHAERVEEILSAETVMTCHQCQSTMEETGLFETSEYLHHIPAKFQIVEQKRVKYRCPCCKDNLQTTPCPSRIKPGSSYSDDFIMEVGLAKYCDLIPIYRFAAIAERSGFTGLPQQSLIETTHYLAKFLEPVVQGIQWKVQQSVCLRADETPHRMLEGDKRKGWYLWGFSCKSAAYFECRSTRGATVASEFLKNASCRFLLSDVYSGYKAAVNETNKVRAANIPAIQQAYCNSHARRRFKEAEVNFPKESDYFIKAYAHIYRLYRLSRLRGKREQRRNYRKMMGIFNEMRAHALLLYDQYSDKSLIAQALQYFLNNFEGLTLFLKHRCIDIDNNTQESLLRNPVIGRKTWYGNHSKLGARTSARLFTIIETCKLLKVNPRAYVRKVVQDLHAKREPTMPWDFKSN